MKLYKNYSKELFSFLVNDTAFYFKITVNEKIKAVDNKIEQNKAQYNLDKQTTKT